MSRKAQANGIHSDPIPPPLVALEGDVHQVDPTR